MEDTKYRKLTEIKMKHNLVDLNLHEIQNISIE